MNWLKSHFNSRWVLVLIGTLLLTCAIIPIGMSLTSGAKIQDLLMNFGTEMAGAFITFMLITGIFEWFRLRETKQESEQELQTRLLREARSSIDHVAVKAFEELRANKWVSGERSILQNANFGRADLRKVPMNNVNFYRSQFLNTKLEGAMLWTAEMQEVKIGASCLRQTILLSANLQDAWIQISDLTGAYFNQANLQGADFYGSQLVNVDFSAADCKGTKFRNTILRGAIFDDKTEFDERTVLPDETFWKPETNMAKFTDPNRSDFWQPARKNENISICDMIEL